MIHDAQTRAQIDELIAANRILFARGIVDAYGHVSVRSAQHPDRFLLAWAKAPGLVDVDDVLLYDFEGKTGDANGREEYSERFIHSSVYAVRPDVHGVVHSHSRSIIPFTVTDAQLRPIWLMSAFLAAGCAKFDTHEFAGDTDLLIKTPELGRAFAQALGERHIGLLRGHGSVSVGRSVREAVFRAIYTEENAKLQAEASRMGNVTFLTEGESALMNRYMQPDVRRPWELWLREIAAAGDAGV